MPCLHSRRMTYWLPLNIGISCLRFYASAGRETCPYLSGLILYNDHYRTQGGKTFSIRCGDEKLFLGCASVRTGLALISVMVVVCASH